MHNGSNITLDYPSGKWNISNVTTNTETVVLDTIPSTYTGIHTFVSNGLQGVFYSIAGTNIATQDGNLQRISKINDPLLVLNISIASTTTTTATVNVGISLQWWISRTITDGVHSEYPRK